jgi:hypothetical protein
LHPTKIKAENAEKQNAEMRKAIKLKRNGWLAFYGLLRAE